MTTTGSARPGLGFAVLGVPVHVDVSFFLLVGLIGAQRLSGRAGFAGFASWVVAVFVSILVHELAHAIAFRRFRLQPSITLYAMGGLTQASGRLTWGRSLVTSLAGPLVGLGFGMLVWLSSSAGLWSHASLFEDVLYGDLLYVNIVWGLVNLLPLHPLDGGQSLEAVLHLARVPGAARKVSITSIVVAGAGVLYGLYVGEAFLALLAGWLGWSNVQRLGALRGGSETGRAA